MGIPRRVDRLAVPMVLAACGVSWAQGLTAQTGRAGAPGSGFESYDPDDSGVRVTDGTSGVVCLDEEGPANVCEAAVEIDIRGEETCDWSDEIQYPCTWYGWEIDYGGTERGDTLVCDVFRSSRTTFGPRTEEVTGERTARYTEALEATHGHLFHPSYNTYAPVEEPVTVGETHRCSYRGR
ncbi:MAG: hypothetical protein PVI57_17475, partial [Gemmatimonadota bacterium]